MSLFVVEGQTAPIDYQILADGSAYSLVGSTVTVVGRKHNGTAISWAGSVTVTDAAQGEVRFSPDAADLVAADHVYYIRFRVVRTDGKIEYFPTGEPESWVVQK